MLGVVDQDEDTGDERPSLIPTLSADQLSLPTSPPSVTFLPSSEYNGSTPAILNSASVCNEASLPPPPDYSSHSVPVLPPKYTPLPGSGASFPVNVHLEGRLVPATLMQDVSICLKVPFALTTYI